MVVTAGPSMLSLSMPPTFAVVILIFAQQSGVVSSALILGKISYSIYMVHPFIVFRIANALEAIERIFHCYGLVTTIGERKFARATPLMGDIMSVAVLGMAILAATISYRLIEFPANQRVRRKVSAIGGSRKATITQTRTYKKSSRNPKLTDPARCRSRRIISTDLAGEVPVFRGRNPLRSTGWCRR